jgi:hypothetical protein
MGVNRRSQFLITSRVLWSASMDMDANRIEARPDTGVDAEKPAQINVSIDADRDLVKLDAKLGCPDPISNGLTGTKHRLGIFHRVRSHIAASQGFGLINCELVSRPHLDSDLARANQVVVRLELGHRLSRIQ